MLGVLFLVDIFLGKEGVFLEFGLRFVLLDCWNVVYLVHYR
jgi:hypothetical protein